MSYAEKLSAIEARLREMQADTQRFPKDERPFMTLVGWALEMVAYLRDELGWGTDTDREKAWHAIEALCRSLGLDVPGIQAEGGTSV